MPLFTDALSSWHVEVLAGRGFTHRDEWTNAAFVDVIGQERPLARGFAWSPMFSVGAVGGSAQFGAERDKTVWFVGGGGRLYIWKGLFASFEAGLVNSRTPAFSSYVQFSETLGWRWDCVVVSLRHLSNGGLESPNYGETMLMVGIRF
jgi:hypothetical protein